MPQIDFSGSQYTNQNGEWKKITSNEGIIIKNKFWNDLIIKTARKRFQCETCNETRPKGTRYVGDTYRKICHKCLELWAIKSTEKIKEINDRFNKIKEETEKNKEQWDKEALIGSLANG